MFLNVSCTLCPRRCGVSRANEHSLGGCGVTATARVARAALHFGEEPCISGTRGSGTVFFAGCPLHCRFCQNRLISQEGFGKDVSPARLSEIFRELEAKGAHNINLVSATQFVPVIQQALFLYKPSVPIVYNSGGYERVETLKTLQGLVDIYLPDFKYIDNSLGQALSGVPDYAERATEAIAEMVRQTGAMQLDSNGIAIRGTMVRHLVLPGHTRHSMAVLDHLAAILPRSTFVSLLFQYTPMGDIEGFPTLSRRVTKRERNKVFEHMLACGFIDGYAQEAGSASKGYIPAFDLSGV